MRAILSGAALKAVGDKRGSCLYAAMCPAGHVFRSGDIVYIHGTFIPGPYQPHQMQMWVSLRKAKVRPKPYKRGVRW